MEANYSQVAEITLQPEAFEQVSTIEVKNESNVSRQNPTIFGEAVQHNSINNTYEIPQTALRKEVSRVEQWINEWKQGLMRIEAGLY